jgi:hypothetical protein
MTQDLSPIIHKTIARGLTVLRKRLQLAKIVAHDYQGEAAQKNEVITVPLHKPKTATAVTPATTPPTPSDASPDSVSIALDQWQHTDAKLTDKDMMQIDANENFIPGELDAAMNGLAEAINTQLWTNAEKFYGYVGTAGTTPFASNSDIIVDARNVLGQQRAPMDQRVGMLNFAAEAKALKLGELKNVYQTGKTDTIIEGQLGRFFGADWYTDDDVKTHTAGTITTGLIAKAATVVAAALKTFVATTAASTGACALLTGDVIAIAGHTTTYVLTANATQASAASDVTLVFEPGLEVALAGSEAITVKATHVINLFMRRDAIQLVTRELAGSMLDRRSGVIMESMTDPVTNITIRAEIMRQYKQWVWDFDVLWGSAVVRRAYGVRIAG